MPKISPKSTVTRKPAAPDLSLDAADLTVEPDLDAPDLDAVTSAAIDELKHQIAAEKGPPLRKRGPDAQWRFLHANADRVVTAFLVNGIRQTGILKEHDQFTIIVIGDDRLERLIYKHAISTVVQGCPKTAPRRAADA